MKIPKLNEDLIEKIIVHIKADFRRYMQDWVGKIVKPGMAYEGPGYEEIHFDEADIPACKTKACFGGWAVLLTTPEAQWASLFLKKGGEMKSDTLDKAEKVLGLLPAEASYLFDTTGNKNPQEDIKIIQKRLKNIRKGRILLEEYNVLEEQHKELQARINNFEIKKGRLQEKFQDANSLEYEITEADVRDLELEVN